MNDVTGGAKSITAASILFMQKNDFRGLDADLLQLLADELKMAIWRQRCRAKYDGKVIQSEDVKRLFDFRVRVRMEADFNRMDRKTFTDLWGRGPNPLARVAGDALQTSGIT